MKVKINKFRNKFKSLFPGDIVVAVEVTQLPNRYLQYTKREMNFETFFEELQAGKIFLLGLSRKEVRTDWEGMITCLVCNEECPYQDNWRAYETVKFYRSSEDEDEIVIYEYDDNFVHEECQHEISMISIDIPY